MIKFESLLYMKTVLIFTFRFSYGSFNIIEYVSKAPYKED